MTSSGMGADASRGRHRPGGRPTSWSASKSYTSRASTARTRRSPAPIRPRDAVEVRALAHGDLAEVGEVVVAGREPSSRLARVRCRLRSRRSDRRARARRPVGLARRPNSGCTRFTISAATARSWSREPLGEERRLLDRVAPRRGHEHERGRRIGEQLPRRRRPASRNPSSMPSNARKNATTSSITSRADDPGDRAQERLHRGARDPEPAPRRHHQQPEDPVVEQPDEPRAARRGSRARGGSAACRRR